MQNFFFFFEMKRLFKKSKTRKVHSLDTNKATFTLDKFFKILVEDRGHENAIRPNQMKK